MNIKRIFRVLVLVVFICSWNALGTTVGIDSVIVIPSLPTEDDIITFDVNGWANQGPSWVEYEEYSQDGLSLKLELFINTEYFHDFTTWTHLKSISNLSANTYTLEVNSYDCNDGSLDDTYIVEFTVVPEPSSIAFFGFSLYILRYVSKRKNK